MTMVMAMPLDGAPTSGTTRAPSPPNVHETASGCDTKTAPTHCQQLSLLLHNANCPQSQGWHWPTQTKLIGIFLAITMNCNFESNFLLKLGLIDVSQERRTLPLTRAQNLSQRATGTEHILRMTPSEIVCAERLRRGHAKLGQRIPQMRTRRTAMHAVHAATAEHTQPCMPRSLCLPSQGMRCVPCMLRLQITHNRACCARCAYLQKVCYACRACCACRSHTIVHAALAVHIFTRYAIHAVRAATADRAQPCKLRSLCVPS
jgi:hypothetical protein